MKRFLACTAMLALGLLATLVPASAQTAWSEWTPLDDGDKNSVDFRYRHAPQTDNEGEYLIQYQFRNRYTGAIKLGFELTKERGTGKVQKIPGAVSLKPSEEGSSGSGTTFAYKIASAKIVSLKVLDADGNEIRLRSGRPGAKKETKTVAIQPPKDLPKSKLGKKSKTPPTKKPAH